MCEENVEKVFYIVENGDRLCNENERNAVILTMCVMRLLRWKVQRLRLDLCCMRSLRKRWEGIKYPYLFVVIIAVVMDGTTKCSYVK